MSLNDLLQRSARVLTNKYGTTATLRRTAKGAFDPVTGTYGPGQTTDYTLKVSPPDAYSQELVDGSLVQADDFQVDIAAADLPIVPDVSDSAMQDKLVLDEQSYSIVKVWPMYGGEQVVLYRLQVRK